MATDDDFQEHQRTWIGFTKLMKWSTIGVVVLMILLALTLI